MTARRTPALMIVAYMCGATENLAGDIPSVSPKISNSGWHRWFHGPQGVNTWYIDLVRRGLWPHTPTVKGIHQASRNNVLPSSFVWGLLCNDGSSVQAASERVGLISVCVSGLRTTSQDAKAFVIGRFPRFSYTRLKGNLMSSLPPSEIKHKSHTHEANLEIGRVSFNSL